MANAFSSTSSHIFGAPTTTTAASPPVFGAKPATERSAFAFGSPSFGVTSQVEDDSTKEKKKEKPVEIPVSSLQKPFKEFGTTLNRPHTRRPRVTTPAQDLHIQHVHFQDRLRPATQTVFAYQAKLESPWRDVQWTEEQKKNLMKTVCAYKPSCKDVPHARVLLLGPVSSGKSSFISSVQSVFNGRVTNRAMVGSFFSTSFTKKLQSFHIRAQKGEDNTRLVLCDVMGLVDGEMNGLTLHDILSVIKGHVPEGHKFSPDQPVGPETAGYVKTPGLRDKIHCVAFVVDASKVASYHKGYSSTFKRLRQYITELGVHQVALLTHIDQICQETAKDVSHVYRSKSVRETMSKAGALLGMSTSYIVPVKNYSSELDLDLNTDVLLLGAVDHILQYVELFFQDYTPKLNGS